MNYNQIYTQLIQTRQALNRIKIPYDGLERHHIIPRCFGGTNETSNIVLLTAREHFIAHRLLVKMHVGKRRAKMVYALNQMMKNNPNQDRKYITSRYFEMIRAYYKLYNMGVNHPSYGKHVHTEETKQQISNRMKGDNNPSRKYGAWNKGLKGIKQNITEEERAKRSERAKNRVWTVEMRQKVGAAHKGKRKSEEHKRKLSEINKGKKLSKETTEKMSKTKRERAKEFPQPIITCPHCNKQGAFSAMHRWHMDRCKYS